MLLSTLSTLIGGFIGVTPKIMSYFETKQRYAYELELAKIKASSDRSTADLNLELEVIKAKALESQSVHGFDDSVDGTDFISKLRSSVRPVITYTFFFLFVLAKITVTIGMFRSGMNITDISLAIFDEPTQGFFGAIMGFWFGSRSISSTQKTRST